MFTSSRWREAVEDGLSWPTYTEVLGEPSVFSDRMTYMPPLDSDTVIVF